jgi:uncharacterized protein YecT (DUF1311 family)
MRAHLFAAAFVLCLAPPAAAQTAPAASALACDTKKLGAKELADCQRAASERSERDLNATLEEAGKNIDGRGGLQSGQKARWKRALNDSHALWLRYRDADCQDVSPFEAAISKAAGDTRLTCIIDHNERRMGELKARYP